MLQKKPSRLSTKPGLNSQAQNPDSWVSKSNGNQDISNLSEPTGKIKRITFEVSEKQHQATKILAAQKSMSIKELMVSLLVSELNKNQ